MSISSINLFWDGVSTPSVPWKINLLPNVTHINIMNQTSNSRFFFMERLEYDREEEPHLSTSQPSSASLKIDPLLFFLFRIQTDTDAWTHAWSPRWIAPLLPSLCRLITPIGFGIDGVEPPVITTHMAGWVHDKPSRGRGVSRAADHAPPHRAWAVHRCVASFPGSSSLRAAAPLAHSLALVVLWDPTAVREQTGWLD